MIPLFKITKRLTSSDPVFFVDLPTNYDELFYEFRAIGWEEPTPQKYQNPILSRDPEGHYTLAYSGEMIPNEAKDGEFVLTVLCTVKTQEFNKVRDYSPLAFLGEDRIYELADNLLEQVKVQNNGRLAFPVELPEGYVLNEFQAALKLLEASGWVVQFPNYGTPRVATLLVEGPFQ